MCPSGDILILLICFELTNGLFNKLMHGKRERWMKRWIGWWVGGWVGWWDGWGGGWVGGPKR